LVGNGWTLHDLKRAFITSHTIFNMTCIITARYRLFGGLYMFYYFWITNLGFLFLNLDFSKRASRLTNTWSIYRYLQMNYKILSLFWDQIGKIDSLHSAYYTIVTEEGGSRKRMPVTVRYFRSCPSVTVFASYKNKQTSVLKHTYLCTYIYINKSRVQKTTGGRLTGCDDITSCWAH